MEYKPQKRELKIDKEINNLDKFVIDFVKILNKYVLVSGYISIVTGRSRATEDVDLLIPKMNLKEFKKIWKRSYRSGFECLNTSKVEEAFKMLGEHAIRFAKKGFAIPNIEFKIISNKIHEYSFQNKIKLTIKDKKMFISPLEIQIAYKLYLGSEKDLEDAKHLYELFKEQLNKDKLLDFIEKFKAKENFNKIK